MKRFKKGIVIALSMAMMVTLCVPGNKSYAAEMTTETTTEATTEAVQENAEATTEEQSPAIADTNEAITEDVISNGEAFSMENDMGDISIPKDEEATDELIQKMDKSMEGITAYKLSTLRDSATTLPINGTKVNFTTSTKIYVTPTSSTEAGKSYGKMYKVQVPGRSLLMFDQAVLIYTYSGMDTAPYDINNGIANKSYYTATYYIWIPSNAPAMTGSIKAALLVSVGYKTHVQRNGWMSVVTNGAVSGTSGESKRLEAIAIDLAGNNNVGIQYTTHVQNYGWLPWVSDGFNSGTQGESKRLEAIKIQLTGSEKDNYDVYYRVHAQSYGWLGWAKNGEPAGTAGQGKRLEAIEIIVVMKGITLPANGTSGNVSVTPVAYVSSTGSTAAYVPNADVPTVMYETHVQSYGWQSYKYSGMTSGTMGQSKRLEAIFMKVTNTNMSGGIQYRTHIQKYGWENGWKTNGDDSGTSGESKRLEAIQIQLTGQLATNYDIYYRVHAQQFGWLGWAKNGESAGTAGYSYRLEGIQVVIVPKGAAAPGSTSNCFVQR